MFCFKCGIALLLLFTVIGENQGITFFCNYDCNYTDKQHMENTFSCNVTKTSTNTDSPGSIPAPVPQKLKANYFVLPQKIGPSLNITWQQKARAVFEETTFYEIIVQKDHNGGGTFFDVRYDNVQYTSENTQVHFVFQVCKYDFIRANSKYWINVISKPSNQVDTNDESPFVKIQIPSCQSDELKDSEWCITDDEDNPSYSGGDDDEKPITEGQSCKFRILTIITIVFALAVCIATIVVLFKKGVLQTRYLKIALCASNEEEMQSKDLLVLVENRLDLPKQYKTAANLFATILKKNENHHKVMFNLWNTNADFLSWTCNNLNKCSDVVLILSENAAHSYTQNGDDDFTAVLLKVKQLRINGQINTITLISYSRDAGSMFSTLKKDFNAKVFNLMNTTTNAYKHIFGKTNFSDSQKIILSNLQNCFESKETTPFLETIV